MLEATLVQTHVVEGRQVVHCAGQRVRLPRLGLNDTAARLVDIERHQLAELCINLLHLLRFIDIFELRVVNLVWVLVLRVAYLIRQVASQLFLLLQTLFLQADVAFPYLTVEGFHPFLKNLGVPVTSISVL